MYQFDDVIMKTDIEGPSQQVVFWVMCSQAPQMINGLVGDTPRATWSCTLRSIYFGMMFSMDIHDKLLKNQMEYFIAVTLLMKPS